MLGGKSTAEGTSNLWTTNFDGIIFEPLEFLLGESSNECIYKPEFKIYFGRNPSIDQLSG